MENKSVGQTMNDHKEILLFGGTTEGRLAAERLLAEGVPCTVCVATSYGEEVMDRHPLLTVHTGRMDRTGMAALMRERGFCCVVDATHPHAQVVSQEAAAACRETGLPYLRLQRDVSAGDIPQPHDERTGPGGDSSFSGKNCVCAYVGSVEEAAAFLAEKTGHILVTTGSKDLVRFAGALGDASRITARVLPAQESLRACAEAGLTGRQIIAMQGPFDTEMNCAMIRHTGSEWLLTKETGAAGGYPEKIEAAGQCGIGAVVIRKPAEVTAESGSDAGARRESDPGAGSSEAPAAPKARRGYSLEETVARALEYAGLTVEEASEPGGAGRILYLVGAGVGSPEALTGGAREAIDSAQVLFGAKSVLDNMKTNGIIPPGKTLVPMYESGKILNYLAEHPQTGSAAVLYSGDSGFYSGASSMLKKLEELRNPDDSEDSENEKKSGTAGRPADGQPCGTVPVEKGQSCTAMTAMTALVKDLEVKVIPGISCVSWFAARAGIPWQDWKILSSHGRFCNVVGQVLRNHRCFLLLSGAEDLRRTAGLLFKAQENGFLGPLSLLCGYELSRPAEEIRECVPYDLLEVTREGLYVLFIQNDLYFLNPVLPGMSDMNFIRQKKVPMTSEEVRVLSLSRLGLTARPVVWDVGAGTGSVSIEAALACPEGRVYSIECKKSALEVLRENRDRYCLSNMEIIEGTAPEALKDLPAPTHVFIGGSGGEIERILLEVFWKNSCARVVVNCVTAETLADLHKALSHIKVDDLDCIQVSVNRMEMLGRYHALHPINPVFIISFNGRGIGTGVQYVAAKEDL